MPLNENENMRAFPNVWNYNGCLYWVILFEDKFELHIQVKGV